MLSAFAAACLATAAASSVICVALFVASMT